MATLRTWPGLTTVLATETLRGGNGTDSVPAQVRHSLGSSTAPSEVLAQAIRRHGALATGEPWVLEVSFGEERSRVRERCAARHLALLRRVALDRRRADASLTASRPAQDRGLGRRRHGPAAQG
ncbi:DDE transposase family protein [Methylobacterium nodulans]|uniref:Transposase, IS4 family protein n=1 Tax=Methylobacterium nodulans (strain LMG 21967 / CNCM I-2342 / ORS 2060) TaxID=460265 RepID=B8IVV4_METNO|nr:transposase, IS4 family protein [Methylobacterium nodulans ORS 2060]